MSELEQNLYKKLSVASSTKDLPGSRTYRGFSSATNDKSFKVVKVALNNFGKLLIIKSKSIKNLYCISFLIY